MSSHVRLQGLLLALRLWGSLPAPILAQTKLLPANVRPPPADFFTSSASTKDAAAEAAAAFFSEQHLEKLVAVVRGSSSSHPRLHSLWGTLLSLPDFTPLQVRYHWVMHTMCYSCRLQIQNNKPHVNFSRSARWWCLRLTTLGCGELCCRVRRVQKSARQATRAALVVGSWRPCGQSLCRTCSPPPTNAKHWGSSFSPLCCQISSELLTCSAITYHPTHVLCSLLHY